MPAPPKTVSRDMREASLRDVAHHARLLARACESAGQFFTDSYTNVVRQFLHKTTTEAFNTCVVADDLAMLVNPPKEQPQ